MVIPLTKGYICLVDDEDFPRLSKHRWFAKFGGNGGGPYAARTQSCRKSSRRCVTIRMHREVMGCLPGFEVNHKNGNTLDNRKSNLEVVLKTENLAKQCYRTGAGGPGTDAEFAGMQTLDKEAMDERRFDASDFSPVGSAAGMF